MIVADSSFIVEGLLKESHEFEEETFLAPDLAVNEVVNAIHVQQHLLHIIDDGLPYLEALYDIVDARLLQVVASSRDLQREAYLIAGRSGGATYDCIYVALALNLNLELETRDRTQARIFESESARLRKNGRQSSESRRPSDND